MDEPTRRRRVRYRGTHPRRFAEKYKELDPARFPAEAAKAAARGATPAGTHRPIMVDEILAALAPRPGDLGLDATLGYGGHAAALLPRLAPGGRLVALDVDPLELPRTEARLRALGHREDVLTVRRMNFAGIAALRAELGRGFDLVLADLGVSSMQLDDPARGFTYKADGPLDLRLNPERGRPAAALLAEIAPDALEALLVENADEPRAARLAGAIVAARARRPLATTRALADLVRRVIGECTPTETRADETRGALARTFQALRIAVNDELGVLDRFLEHLPGALAPGGRVAILSFHSGEDRRVKKAFQAGARAGIYASVSEEPIRAGRDERRANPRAIPAKLRGATRAGAG